MSEIQDTALFGFCRCGCGTPTRIATRNRHDLGHVKGRPTPYAHGHNASTRPVVDGHKTCTKCGNNKPVFDFWEKSKKIGCAAWCIACSKEYARARRDAGLVPRPSKPRRIDPVENRRRVREWQRRFPEKRRRQAVRDAMRRRGAPLRGEHREFAESVLVFDPCCYCGKRAGGTIEHIVPISKGGDSEWTNLAGACLECNSGKGNKDLLSYLLHRVALAEL